MTMRKILQVTATNPDTLVVRAATVYRDSQWNEYKVTLKLDGVFQRGADYLTDDKQDAIDTASHMVHHATYCTGAQGEKI